jgi:GNAT superfamily N-acetyltransferase
VQRRPETVVKFARAELYIHEFGVDHEEIASGVGSASIAYIADVARAKGIHRIGVDGFARNGEARHFYESRGFEVEREVRWLIPSAQGPANALCCSVR